MSFRFPLEIMNIKCGEQWTSNVYTLASPACSVAPQVSVPDALSGIAVVKEGHGDMAVSNAIGRWEGH